MLIELPEIFFYIPLTIKKLLIIAYEHSGDKSSAEEIMEEIFISLGLSWKGQHKLPACRQPR